MSSLRFRSPRQSPGCCFHPPPANRAPACAIDLKFRYISTTTAGELSQGPVFQNTCLLLPSDKPDNCTEPETVSASPPVVDSMQPLLGAGRPLILLRPEQIEQVCQTAQALLQHGSALHARQAPSSALAVQSVQPPRIAAQALQLLHPQTVQE